MSKVKHNINAYKHIIIIFIDHEAHFIESVRI